MEKGQCPVCKRAFEPIEWSQMPSHTEYTYVDCIPQIEGDVTQCPGCGEYVQEDLIRWRADSMDDKRFREIFVPPRHTGITEKAKAFNRLAEALEENKMCVIVNSLYLQQEKEEFACVARLVLGIPLETAFELADEVVGYSQKTGMTAVTALGNAYGRIVKGKTLFEVRRLMEEFRL